MAATHDFYPVDPTIWMTIIAFSRLVVKLNVIFFSLLFFSYEILKNSKNEWLKWIKKYSGKMKILSNLLTVDYGRANFRLHGGI